MLPSILLFTDLLEKWLSVYLHNFLIVALCTYTCTSKTDVFGHLAAFLASCILIGFVRKHRSVLNIMDTIASSENTIVSLPPWTGLIFSLLES